MASAPSAMKIMVVSLLDGEICTVGTGSFSLRDSLSQCETYELLDGEITTVGTKILSLRGNIVPTKLQPRRLGAHIRWFVCPQHSETCQPLPRQVLQRLLVMLV